jgi:ribonuclease VapC
MIVDTSALLAVLLGEHDDQVIARTIADAPTRTMSAASYVELTMVALSRRGTTRAEIDRRLDDWRIAVAPVTVGQARLAADAFGRFGKGRHPAALNLGDCFAYALARERNEPLLFKGDGFARTDVAIA